MSVFTLTIRCDSAAFGHSSSEVVDEYDRNQEIARLLQVAAVRVARHMEESAVLLDLKGENCGHFGFES